MARSKKPAENNDSPIELLEALDFISIAQHTTGEPFQTHCRLSNGTLSAFNGGITAGHYIKEQLNVCPHTDTFIKALKKCNEKTSITELDSGRLSIKSGKFKALIPCIPYHHLANVEPDPPVATLTEAVKTALARVVALTVEGNQRPYTAGVLLQAGTAVATNGNVVLEAFHGIDLPPNILLPKSSTLAICKSIKPLKQFGFSENSATFYFEDGSFIKTQLFRDTYPDYKRIIEIPSSPTLLPEGFYEALDTVIPFAINDIIYFGDDCISSHRKTNEGAAFEIKGLKPGLSFNSVNLRLIKNFFHNVHFDATHNGLTVFFSEDGLTRGGIMKVAVYENN